MIRTEPQAGQEGAATHDVVGTIARWRARARDDQRGASEAARPWLAAGDVGEYAWRCTREAARAMEQSRPAPPGAARFCVVGKAPHVQSWRTVLSVAARLAAFGVEVLEVRRLGEGDAVAQALYPGIHAGYLHGPDRPWQWDALSRRFDSDDFASIHGRRYDRRMVVSGRSLLTDFGLTESELTEVWEEGRRPIPRSVLAARYGPAVAGDILRGRESYDWFRGALPMGIQPIDNGLVAFAMRHHKINDGRPTIVVNGHFPGLSALLARSPVMVCATDAHGPQLADVRDFVIGDRHGGPLACPPGTLRRDTADAVLAVDSALPVSTRNNVVHCSDGFLAGQIEESRLLGRDGCEGGLAELLLRAGLIDAEIRDLVLADPRVGSASGERSLSALTAGQALDDCVATILRHVPPVFGPANGFACGIAIETVARAFEGWREGAGPAIEAARRPAALRGLTETPRAVGDWPAGAEEAGLSAFADGAVGVVVPAGGTGGRFGGYGVPESDPARQKALLPLFRVAGRERSALDIRLANVAHWRRATGGRIPAAVLASPTNHAAITAWRDGLARMRLDDVAICRQHGIYRVSLDGRSGGTGRWIDAILRSVDGTPSLKPPGNLGGVLCLALDGILDEWTRAGVRHLVLANGDDVGFRLEPGIVGMLEQDDRVDAVVAGVPWGRRETGGTICELLTPLGWRVAVAEKPAPGAPAGETLYSSNHMYIRLRSLRRVLGLDGCLDPIATLRGFADRQPLHMEEKEVLVDGAPRRALQIAQGANDVLRLLSCTPLAMQRFPTGRQRGGYLSLKYPSDVPLAQTLLDFLERRGDDLDFATG